MPTHENQAQLANTKTKTGLDGKSGARVEIADSTQDFPGVAGTAAYEPQVALGDVYDPNWNSSTDTTP